VIWEIFVKIPLNDAADIGALVRATRKAHGIRQDNAADAIGVSENLKELWKFQTGSGVVAPPVTWEGNGEQYVSVLSSWGGAVPLWGAA
jgi:hypothetical protein